MQILWPHHHLFPGGASPLDDDLSHAYQLERRLSEAPLFSEAPPSFMYLARCTDELATRLIQDYITGSCYLETDAEYRKIAEDIIPLDVNARWGSHDLSLLHVLVIKGHIAASTLLLDAYKEGPIRGSALDVNIADVRGFAAAHHAAVLGHKVMINLLRAHGADLMGLRNFRNGSAMDLLGHCWTKSSGSYSETEEIFHKSFIHPALLVEDWVQPKTCEPNERQASLERKLAAATPLPSWLCLESGIVKAKRAFLKADPVGFYAGQILPEIFSARVESAALSIKMGGDLFIDGRHGSLLARATPGHPNVMLDSLVDHKGLPRVFIGFATRNIGAGEEIFLDAIGKQHETFSDRAEIPLKQFWENFDIKIVQEARAQYATEPTLGRYIATRDVEISYIFRNSIALLYLLKDGTLYKRLCVSLFDDYEQRLSSEIFDEQMGNMAPVTRNIMGKVRSLKPVHLPNMATEVYAIHQEMKALEEDDPGDLSGLLEALRDPMFSELGGASGDDAGDLASLGKDAEAVSAMLSGRLAPMLAAAGGASGGDLADLGPEAAEFGAALDALGPMLADLGGVLGVDMGHLSRLVKKS